MRWEGWPKTQAAWASVRKMGSRLDKHRWSGAWDQPSRFRLLPTVNIRQPMQLLRVSSEYQAQWCRPEISGF